MNLGAVGSVGTFRDMFQEFRTVPDTVVNGYLAQAAARISASELGTSYDEYHGNLTAHLIATSPAGVSSRMVNHDGSTTYQARLVEIRDAYICAVGVT